MNNDELTLNIIDRQRRNKTSKLRQVAFVIPIILIILIMYLPNFKILSIDPFVVKAFLILILAFILPIGLWFANNTPTKGKIVFHSNSIQIQMGKKIVDIPLNDQNEITFYNIVGEGLYNALYFIEFRKNNISMLFEMDIVFAKEKARFENVKLDWKKRKIDFKEKNTLPNNGYRQ